MRPKDEIAKWESKVAELEQQETTAPTPQLAELLSDARNYLRFVKARHEDVSKQRTR